MNIVKNKWNLRKLGYLTGIFLIPLFILGCNDLNPDLLEEVVEKDDIILDVLVEDKAVVALGAKRIYVLDGVKHFLIASGDLKLNTGMALNTSSYTVEKFNLQSFKGWYGAENPRLYQVIW